MTNPQNPSQASFLSDETYDVAIIGAGVVGCAIARRFTLEGAKVAVLEKASDILDGASKANSAILHTGFDAPAGSLELQCIRDGYEEYLQIRSKTGLPFEKSGAHVVAWNKDELDSLEAIVNHGHNNGITDVEQISVRQLKNSEPNLAEAATGAVFVPGEGIIDPWSAPYVYLRQSIVNGGEFFHSSEIIGGSFSNDQWLLETSRGKLKARHIINAAGLYGDKIDEILTGSADFKITPRKGQFVVFDKAAYQLVNSIILPVPSERTKGIVVCRTIFGNLLVGPTAEDQESRDDASVVEQTLESLVAAGLEKLPALKDMPITAIYSGLRPASEFKDYQIKAKSDQNWITVGAIRSTGLSGALGIARHVFSLYEKSGAKHKSVKTPRVPQATILAQSSKRDWQNANNGAIVCHCELVTEREINQALEGPLAARSLAGLKRQTRATMGRCQGFFCSARLGELTDGKLEPSICKGDKS